ncbi:hypothetical protein ACWDA7_47290 [Streptomyces sp. NPDC001156]
MDTRTPQIRHGSGPCLATYRQLAERPGRTELRRRLHRLSSEVLFHPYWQGRGRTSAEGWELRNPGRGGRSGR